MRVGLYIHNYIPTSGGGYTFQREIFKAILSLASQTKHHFFVLAYVNFPAQVQSESIEFIPIKPLPQVKRSKKWQRNPLCKIWHRIKKISSLETQPSIMQSLSALDLTAREHHIDFIWFITPAYELTNTPYMATVWDLQHRLQPWFPEVGNLAEWEGREAYIATFLRRAAYVIAPNKTGQKEINLFYQIPEDRILCLPHPTPDLVSIKTEEELIALEKYDLHPGFLFYPGQYWAHKNHANLLFALKILKETHLITLTTVFVGSDKGNLEFLKKLAAELGVESQVRFLGFVNEDELTAFYKNALALVYPSFFGPENLPPLEAFSVGCPVIAANVKGAEEQLGDAAILVNPAHAEEIALAVKFLLENPLQKEMLIARGLERAMQVTALDYARRVIETLDEFELIRRAWEI